MWRLTILMVALTTSALARAAEQGSADAVAELPPPPTAQGATPGEPAERGALLRADAFQEYQLRSSPDARERDQDAHLLVDAGGSDATRRFGVEALLDLWWDLDGAAPSPSGLAAVHDGRNPWLGVYQLSGEYRGDGVVRLVRAGRQGAEHGRRATFDGLYTLLRPTSALSLFAFGGRSEHFFDLEQGLFEDWMASAGAVARLSQSIKLEADYRLLREAIAARDSDERRAIVDHTYGVTGRFRGGDWLLASLSARGLGAQLSEAGASARISPAGRGYGIDLRGSVRPVRLREVDELESAYYLVLGESLPHARWRVDLWADLDAGEGVVSAHLGAEARRLLSDSETPFNRNTGRAWLTFAAQDLGVEGLRATASLERVAETAALDGEGAWVLGGALGYSGKWGRAEAGTQFHRWLYSYYRDVEERADVRVFFADLRVVASDWLTLRARYSYELFDRQLHSLNVGVAQAW